MTHRIGGVLLDGVRMTSRAYEGDGVRLTFYIDDGFPVPSVSVPCVVDVVADGQELGVKTVCCSGRSEQEGCQHVSIKWRGD